MELLHQQKTIPLILELAVPTSCLATLRSPKSAALPVNECQHNQFACYNTTRVKYTTKNLPPLLMYHLLEVSIIFTTEM